MSYDVIITTLRDRADLLDRTLRSMLPQLDTPPARLIVHEDVRPDAAPPPGPSTKEVLEALGVPFVYLCTEPGLGLARAMVRLLDAVESEFVFYTQEDFDFVRKIPVASCLQIMAEHRLNHIRFNKRKTMRVKGAHRDPEHHFTKLEVTFGEQMLCVSDHWYFQANMGRASVLRDGFIELSRQATPGCFIDRGEMKFNHWLNTTIGKGVGSTDGTGAATRGMTVKTFIWGGIGEPPFIQHTGYERSSQNHPGH